MSKLAKLIITIVIVVIAAAIFFIIHNDKNPPATDTQQADAPKAPKISTNVIASGLNKPWDVAVSEEGEIFFTEKNGSVGTLIGSEVKRIGKIEDVVSKGEGGLLGMTLDPDFSSNRLLYACFNTGSDVTLARFKIDEEEPALSERKDLVEGIPSNDSGRHSGCRPRFASDGTLFIGTGDAATGENPQDPKSLGGKILRIDRAGKGVSGNLGGQFDERIYSYGHRNIQGLAMFDEVKDNSYGYSVEHGPNVDDEVNSLVVGNFGWNPIPSYNESAPMTDQFKFPDAVVSVWSSGKPTLAPSGATMIYGNQWGTWNGSLAVAMLKGNQVRIFNFDSSGKISDETKILENIGRVRSIVQAPDGLLYVTTDNGNNQDVIIRVKPD